LSLFITIFIITFRPHGPTGHFLIWEKNRHLKFTTK
jgi:hypothetical protein